MCTRTANMGIRYCIVSLPLTTRGGISTAVKNLYVILKSNNCDVKWFDVRKLPNPFVLNKSCDIIHVHYPLTLSNILKIIFAYNPRKIVTFHGWIYDEAKLILLGYAKSDILGEASLLKRIVFFAYFMVVWQLYRILLIPLVFDYSIAVSNITAIKNKLSKYIIIPNAYVKIEKRAHKIRERSGSNVVKMATYLSIGGGKVLSLYRLLEIIFEVNRLLKKEGKIALVYIYGKDFPNELREKISKIPFVVFRGFVDRKDFISELKNMDLFIIPYDMPELGYAVLDAISLCIPIAKITEDFSKEEIIDGFNGILAQNSSELAEKIAKYVSTYSEMLDQICVDAVNTILRKRTIEFQQKIWRIVVNGLIKY